MKTERRHELKHNSLDAELVKIVDYFKKHGRGISLAILVLVAAISVGWVVIRNRAAAVSVPRQDYDLFKASDVSTAEGRVKALTGFEGLADQTGNMGVAALACVEAGDICVRQQAAGDLVSGALDRAKKHYQRVVSEFSDFPVAAGRAYLGLARLAEGKNEFTAAREHYQQVIALGDKTSQLALTVAENSLKTIGDLERPIRLATTRPAPPPAPPTSQPDTQPAVGPAVSP
ncbi:MAG: hypothetical protein QGG42_01700 [Phycisphaerae bacterium]|jgi:hypothetical protein|nr:hypothetical protein [Phycisphaerae bacterium]